MNTPLTPIEFKGLDNLINNTLGYKRGEKIILAYDDKYRIISDKLVQLCKEQNIDLTFFNEGESEGASDKLKQYFLDETHQIIILALTKHIWHTEERKKAKYEKNKKIANVLYSEGVCDSFLTDISQIKKLARQIEPILSKSKKIEIYSKAGTELTARIGKTFNEIGNYSFPGSGGDFPSGEIGFGPVEGSVNGRLVYDFKIQHIGFVKDSPHIIEVTRDLIKPITTTPTFIELLKSNPVLNYLSEISISTNPIWTEVANINSIVEEKNAGTIHFGQGSNLSYGNRRGKHFDCVILKPTIILEGLTIMENGIFNNKYINTQT